MVLWHSQANETLCDLWRRWSYLTSLLLQPWCKHRFLSDPISQFRELNQRKTIHVFLHSYFFLLVYLLKLAYLWNTLQTVSCQEKNAEKSSELHFYIHFITRSVKENNNNKKRTKKILSTVLFFKKRKTCTIFFMSACPLKWNLCENIFLNNLEWNCRLGKMLWRV